MYKRVISRVTSLSGTGASIVNPIALKGDRSFRLRSLLKDYDGDVDLDDEPKVVIHASTRAAIMQCLVHFPSIAITLILATLCARVQFWNTLNNTNISALQFGAKLHEVLIIASLSSIVLHRVRFMLMGRSGVQLGLLASGFQLSSILYHLRSEFWGAFSLRERPFGEALISVVIFSITFLTATLAGPSSAITMVPKLDWYSMRTCMDNSSGGSFDSALFIDASPQQLFPQVFDKSLLASDCFSPNATTIWDCPSAGFSRIMDSQLYINESSSTTRGHLRSVNVTMPSERSRRGRVVSSFILNGGGSTAYTPPDFISHAFVHQWKQSTSYYHCAERPRITLSDRNTNKKTHLSLMPFVSALCMPTALESGPIYFPSSASQSGLVADRCNNDTCIYVDDPNSISIALEDRSGKVNFISVNLSNSTYAGPLAGAFITSSPYGGKFGYIFTCVLDARWRQQQFWTTPGTDMIVHAPVNEDSLARSDATTEVAIQIDSDWFAALDVKLPVVNGSQTAMEIFGKECIRNVLYAEESKSNFNDTVWATADCISQSLALFVVDGISRTKSSATQVLSAHLPHSNYTISDLQDSTRFTQLQFHIDQYGYAYSFRSGIVRLAFSILFGHMILAVVHICVVIASRKSSNAWNHIGDIIALAINSPPSPHLRNSGGGVGNRATWALRVKVREVEEGRLVLVVQGKEYDMEDLEDARLVVPERKYS